MPLVDDIQAAGLTPLQLKGKLTERLKDFVEAPNVTVIVMEANSFKVYFQARLKLQEFSASELKPPLPKPFPWWVDLPIGPIKAKL